MDIYVHVKLASSTRVLMRSTDREGYALLNRTNALMARTNVLLMQFARIPQMGTFVDADLDTSISHQILTGRFGIISSRINVTVRNL
uniref:Uncharacterized protein n=1 Tax=Parascaris equorum TaxID=6256 RepID=A0A914R4X9_PAREQ